MRWNTFMISFDLKVLSSLGVFGSYILIHDCEGKLAMIRILKRGISLHTSASVVLVVQIASSFMTLSGPRCGPRQLTTTVDIIRGTWIEKHIFLLLKKGTGLLLISLTAYEHNLRSSLVNGNNRSLLLYKHLLDVGHISENGNDQVGFCESYYSEEDDRGAWQNNGLSDEEGTPTTAGDIGASHSSNTNALSDAEGTPATTEKIGTAQGSNTNGLSGHSCPINPQQAMENLVFIVEVLNVNTYVNVTVRSKMKHEKDMRE
jgi:hypothetical protein